MDIHQRLGVVMADERRRFEEQHRRSKEMAEQAQTHLVS
ncbi:MAG: hypothetical protein RL080_663, partial [Actinomycetota bacterium]